MNNKHKFIINSILSYILIRREDNIRARFHKKFIMMFANK